MEMATASWRKDKGSANERGYTSAWRKARNVYLRKYPLCVMCQADGKVTPANVVDHITPHHGDQELFWNEDNWQSLCKIHHDSDKQLLERSGTVRAKFDANGRVVW